MLQTGKLSSHHLILIYGRQYWDKVLNWKHMVSSGTISESEYKLLQFADTAFQRADLVLSALASAPEESQAAAQVPQRPRNAASQRRG